MRNMKQSRQDNQTEKSRKKTLQREENFFLKKGLFIVSER